MKILRTLRPVPLALAILACTPLLLVRRAEAQTPNSAAADNSAQNKSQSTTADNQSNAKADRTLAAQVRKAILADKDLSTYAHNVKVIVANGTVTLKGPVNSTDEKQKLSTDVATVVSEDKIANQITVK